MSGMLPMSKMNPDSRNAGKKVVMMAICPATNWLLAMVEMNRPMPRAVRRNSAEVPNNSQGEPRRGTSNSQIAMATESASPPIPRMK
ncbi:hypothetical protein GALL_396720 [mine drainage metagenome]|uniref:Uncharacterized protein n=1 Tax=mine drainage metagenome TaxID=410659 RepID=A0A1J5QF40_9ZZZZ